MAEFKFTDAGKTGSGAKSTGSGNKTGGIILAVVMYYLIYYMDMIQIVRTYREKKHAEKEYVRKHWKQ